MQVAAAVAAAAVAAAAVVVYSNLEQRFHTQRKTTHHYRFEEFATRNILHKKFSTWFYHHRMAQPQRYICFAAAAAGDSVAVYCAYFTSWQATNPIQNGWRNRLDKPDYLGFRAHSSRSLSLSFTDKAWLRCIVFDIVFFKGDCNETTKSPSPPNRKSDSFHVISFHFLWIVTFIWDSILAFFPNR